MQICRDKKVWERLAITILFQTSLLSFSAQVVRKPFTWMLKTQKQNLFPSLTTDLCKSSGQV